MAVSISYRLHKRGVTDTKGTRIVKPAQPFVAITKPSFGDGVWRPAVWLQQEICHLLAERGNYTARALRWLQREEKLAALRSFSAAFRQPGVSEQLGSFLTACFSIRKYCAVIMKAFCGSTSVGNRNVPFWKGQNVPCPHFYTATPVFSK